MMDGYSLRLAGGLSWHILSTEDANSFIDTFSNIAALHKGNIPGSTRLIYTRSGLAAGIKVAGGLPEAGWTHVNMGLVQLWLHEETPDVICDIGPEMAPGEEALKLSLSLLPLYRGVVLAGGIPVHGALVEREGHGVLLVGRGGAGKSTCSRRIPLPWHPLSDDMALIVRAEPYRVHPVPTWSNFVMDRPQREWDMQRHTSLDAFFFLEQAKADEAVRIGEGEAAMRIYESSLQVCHPLLRLAGPEYGSALKKQVFLNACQVAKAAPSHILRVDLHGRFWDEMDRSLLEA